jgi:hypothetical protein
MKRIGVRRNVEEEECKGERGLYASFSLAAVRLPRPT